MLFGIKLNIYCSSFRVSLLHDFLILYWPWRPNFLASKTWCPKYLAILKSLLHYTAIDENCIEAVTVELWLSCLVQVVMHDGVQAVHTALGDNRIKNFYSIYKSRADWQSVDGFVCMQPAATCELFVPFNRSLIIVTTTRYEAGRRSIGDWRRWNSRLERIMADGRNFVAANNQYDIEYMRSAVICRLHAHFPSYAQQQRVTSLIYCIDLGLYVCALLQFNQY